MKLFLPVSGFLDCLKIQSDLNKLSKWCDRNSLLVNVGKCKTITFARSRRPVEFSYMLGGTVLDRVCSINDLGVIMDKKMIFYGVGGRYGCKGQDLSGQDLSGQDLSGQDLSGDFRWILEILIL
jgi:hypothetical protein